MGTLGNIPVAGWIVIAVLGILAFIVFMVRGVRVGKGDKFLSVGLGQTMDKKFDEFKTEIDKKEKNRLHDEELRKKLFRLSNEIDERTKADERRVIRRLHEQITNIFAAYIKCELPGMAASEIIKEELEERVDYNCMRERLGAKERSGYIVDILYHIELDYASFLLRIPQLPCNQETYPRWSDIVKKTEAVVNTWADETMGIIIKRIEEKIETYMSEKDNFILPEYKELCVEAPVRKNKKYLKALCAHTGGGYDAR